MAIFSFKELPMTLVMALRESDDAILIAADSEATEDFGYKGQMSKLQRVSGVQVVWGSAGNPDIGLRQFGRWVSRYDWKGKTWEQVSRDAIDELARLNGEQRRRTVEIARAEIKGGFLADCILAGWLQGEPGMYALSDDGRMFSVWDKGFYAIGSGAQYAYPAYNTIMLMGGTLNADSLKTILHGAITFAPNCGPPAECWRVGKFAVSVVFTLKSKVE